MKKIFTILAATLLSVTAFADRQLVWEGDSAISWNQDVYKGGQFIASAEQMADLYKGDTILVTLEDKIESTDHRMTFQCGPKWEWTDIVTSASDGLMSYVLTEDTVAEQIRTRGLIIRGQGYNIKKIQIAELQDDPSWTETSVWSTTDPVAISWSPNEWAGSYIETYTVSPTLFSTIKKGNVIRVHISSVTSESQFQISYKTGENWEWTPYSYSLGHQMINIPVESDDDAALIAERGIVISGYKYYVNSIGVYVSKDGATAIDNTTVDTKALKFVRDGHIFILRDGVTYTLQGQIVQ